MVGFGLNAALLAGNRRSGFCLPHCYAMCMDQTAVPRTARQRALRFVGNATLYTLAAIGLIWLIGGPVVTLVAAPMFVTDIVRSVPSPDQSANAEVEVRKGGLGTVWTTRVNLRRSKDSEYHWTIYKAKDSDFVPTLRWVDRDTLVITLPCERFDYASNPDDWKRSNPAERRIKVRFTYPDECRLASP